MQDDAGDVPLIGTFCIRIQQTQIRDCVFVIIRRQDRGRWCRIGDVGIKWHLHVRAFATISRNTLLWAVGRLMTGPAKAVSLSPPAAAAYPTGSPRCYRTAMIRVGQVQLLSNRQSTLPKSEVWISARAAK
jgi:hypothetical protein